MQSLTPLRRTALLVGALLLALSSHATAAPRLVAVGDIHGDMDAFDSILQRAELTDEAGRWIGGDATLVQTGDFLDRGPRFRGIMDRLMGLEEAASAGGGRVVVLLGNHEVMNILGDLRYVTRENFADFADDRSEKRREKAWKEYVRHLRRRASILGRPAPDTGEAARHEWMEKHPPGYMEHREAFGAGGSYGRWLRKHAAIAQVDNAVFLHGGISPELPTLDVDEIRERVASEIAWFDDLRDYMVQQKLALPFFDLPELEKAAKSELERLDAAGSNRAGGVDEKTLRNFLNYRSWYAVSGDGPLWFRGFARWSDEEGLAPASALLETFGVDHFVVGHSVTPDKRVGMRFDGGVFLIDTGMLSSHYDGGRASALELRDGEATAIYLDERVVLLPAREQGTGSAARLSDIGEIARASMAARQAAVQPRALLRPAPAEEGTGSGEAEGFRWTGPDGEPLPFETEEELVAFLKTAEIVEKERIKSGINQPFKVTLEQDGIRMHAVFRDVEMEQRMANVGGRREMGFRDSYIMEPAAYFLSKMLGMDNVPPAVLRKMGKTPGSLQAWLEGAMTERHREEEDIQPPDFVAYNRQQQDIRVFDNLIYNTDRNPGNTLIDGDWKLWAIDHTRAFRREKEIHTPPGFAQCERGLFDAIRNLDEEEATVVLSDYLRKAEIKAIFQRRDKLVEYVQDLMEKMGEDRVLYSARP